MRFKNRRHAGEVLGEAVAAADPADPVVYALPRGGVPVGFEVARSLRCPLDVLIVRKVGVPYQPELAMGAIAEGGAMVINEDVMTHAGISSEVFQSVVEEEEKELAARVRAYRSVAAAIPPTARTAIVVDDGLATGSTALAALSVLEGRADAVWLAVPVAPADTVAGMGRRFDRVIVVSQPEQFGSVGWWFRDFAQTSDDEVRNLLSASRLT